METKSSQSVRPDFPSKKELRCLIRNSLVAMKANERASMSHTICCQVADWVKKNGFQSIAVFAAGPWEVDLLPLLDMLPQCSWYFPLVHEERKLSFHRVCHPSELVAGYRNIREPGNDCPELDVMSMDLMILPGAAFSRDGKRLGYGGGFYDVLLSGPASKLPLIGVCFPCQLLENIPMEAHDRCVDGVITPEGVWGRIFITTDPIKKFFQGK